MKPNLSSSARGADLAGRRARDPAYALHRVEHALPRVDLLHLLGQVGRGHRAPAADPPSGGVGLAGEQPQHRRLAGSVDPHQAEPVAGSEPPGRPREQLSLPPHQVDVLEVDDVLAQALGREALQLEAVAGRWHVGDQRVGGVDAELGLGGARGRAPAQPCQLLAHQVLPAGLRRGGLPLALGAGEDVRRVAALVHVDGGVVDLPGLLAHGVEEPAVVGDDHQRAGARHQVPGEPVHRLDVEVVGGLVEQQQVVVLQEQPCQRAPATLPARETVDDAFEVDPREQHLHDLAGGAVGRPLVLVLARQHHVAHPGARLRGVGLGEVAEPQPARLGHPARVGALTAGEQVEERGLAVAVAADDPDPLARRQAEADLAEQRADAVGLRHPLQVDQVHWKRPPWRAPTTFAP